MHAKEDSYMESDGVDRLKNELIKREIKCFNYCVELARQMMMSGNTKHARVLLEDAIKSVDEIERLSQNEQATFIRSEKIH